MIADSLKNLNKLFFIFLIVTIFVSLDQTSKHWSYKIVQNPTNVIRITEFFNIVMIENNGISFGMFQGFEYSNLFFIVTTVTIMMFLLRILYNETRYSNVFYLCLILSGAIGNLIDRLKYGAVRDFIDLHLDNYHWPVFNLADGIISIGVLTYILANLKKIS